MIDVVEADAVGPGIGRAEPFVLGIIGRALRAIAIDEVDEAKQAVAQLNAWDILNKRTLLTTKAGIEAILA